MYLKDTAAHSAALDKERWKPPRIIPLANAAQTASELFKDLESGPNLEYFPFTGPSRLQLFTALYVLVSWPPWQAIVS